MEAITSELASDPSSRERRPPLDSGPEIVVGTTALGRETLAAIEEELKPAQPLAATRIKARRGGRSSRPPAPKAKERRAFADAMPEILVGEAAAQTMPDIIAGDGALQATAKLEIFEILTFIVKNVEAAEFSTESRRRAFVERHLSRPLRDHSVESIARVDVTPWTERGSVVLRIWYRVS